MEILVETPVDLQLQISNQVITMFQTSFIAIAILFLTILAVREAMDLINNI